MQELHQCNATKKSRTRNNPHLAHLFLLSYTQKLTSKGKLILALTGCFGLLLTLYAGLLVVFSLTDFLLDARLCAASLETTQSAVQSLILFYDNARHFFYPPFSPFQMESSPASHEIY